MSVRPGQSLSHYEVLAPLGAGAMGEVYRARDTKLGREVAIKVLPEHFADDAERLKRFEREATTLASLNHPNVAQIFGVDQVEDTCFLVLELVPGESLEERLKRGPLPLEEALDVAKQIAEGLEAAHEAGVIHRDLKPANVRVTPDGKVKVLDFGLAKTAIESSKGPSTDSVLSTEAGRLLGTPTYMAPEQARGKSIDKRVDIWAFGCVLFECLTAKRAFVGETLTDVLGAVLHSQADLSALPASTPERVRELLERCFVKDPRARLRDVGEARVLLQAPHAAPRAARAVEPARSPARVLPWALFAIAGAAAGFFALRAPSTGPVPAPSIGYRFRLPRPTEGAGFPELSPDGRYLVSTSREGLWVRALDEPSARRLEGTEDARSPFWSPDSRQIGFFADGKLQRVGLGGAPPVVVADFPPGWALATWSVDGTLLLDLTESTDEEGWYVVEPGATRARKIRGFPPDREVGPDKSHPWFLPDGRHFLFTQPFEEKPWLQLGSLDSPEVKRLTNAASKAVYVEPGYVLYVRDGVLLAHAFDLRSFELSGDPQEVERGVSFFSPTGAAAFTASQQGTLVFQPVGAGSTLKWFDREGHELQTVLRSDQHVRAFDLAPDDKRIAYSLVDSRNGTADLWLFDLEREVPSRLTSAARGEYSPCFDPSGTRLAFSADWKGPPNLHLLDLSGAAPRELVPFDRHVQWPAGWTPDGKSVAYTAATGSKDSDLWIVDVASGERRALLSTKFNEGGAQLAPDGRRIAYVSDASGRSEVYLSSFPMEGEALRISAGGGSAPRWSADGRELLFQSPDDAIVSVAIEVDAGGTVRAGKPKLLFHLADRTLREWSLSRDGQRFLVRVEDAAEEARGDEVIVDWPKRIGRRQ
ncbi:MAG: protein kinase [Planctomycetes bacterium]|nr:protein kinase [Planctomycetota bacterium]